MGRSLRARSEILEECHVERKAFDRFPQDRENELREPDCSCGDTLEVWREAELVTVLRLRELDSDLVGLKLRGVSEAIEQAER